jgi:ABC-type transport system substrate-binding protein
LEPQEVDLLQGRTDLVVRDARMFTNSFVALNSEGDGKQFFSDMNVRLSLAQAIDRTRIVNEVLAGRADPDATPIPTANWAYSAAAANLHPFDPVASAKGLEAAGWVVPAGDKIRSKNGVPFKVELAVADSYPNRQVADAVARQMLDVGVQVNVKALSATQLVQNYLLTHKYQMALTSTRCGTRALTQAASTSPTPEAGA